MSDNNHPRLNGGSCYPDPPPPAIPSTDWLKDGANWPAIANETICGWMAKHRIDKFRQSDPKFMEHFHELTETLQKLHGPAVDWNTSKNKEKLQKKIRGKMYRVRPDKQPTDKLQELERVIKQLDQADFVKGIVPFLGRMIYLVGMDHTRRCIDNAIGNCVPANLAEDLMNGAPSDRAEDPTLGEPMATPRDDIFDMMNF